MPEKPKRGRPEVRKLTYIAIAVAAVVGTLGVLVMANGNEHAKHTAVPAVASVDAVPPADSAAPVPKGTMVASPSGLPKGHMTQDGKPVPQFIAAQKLPEWRQQALGKYQAFVSDAGLTYAQEETFRQALADATLTYYLGFQYVKGGTHSGVKTQDISDAAGEDIQRGLQGLTERQREAFRRDFGDGDTLYSAKLFDVDPLVKELMPDTGPPTEPPAGPPH
jgi:hypothetical protein